MPELTAGLRLTVTVPSESEPGGVRTLTSSLEGFGDNKQLMITAPAQGNEEVFLPVNQKVRLQCLLASAVIDFDAVVLEKIEKGSLSYLLLKRTGAIRRAKRRQNLACMKDGWLEYSDPEDGTSQRLKIVVSDIGGGGASVRGPAAFPSGASVIIHMPFGEKDDIHSYLCEVKRCFEVEDSVADLKYNVSVQFRFKNIREKEELISRILRMERERRSI